MMKKRKAKKYEGIRVNFAERSGKYRNGLYLVLSAKGYPRRELKLREGVPIDDMVNHYKDRYISKITKKNIWKYLKDLRQGQEDKQKVSAARRKIGKRKRIDSSIRSGLTSTKPFDLLSATTATIRQKYAELLKPLVKDRELLKLVMQNAEKIKHRFTYETTVLGNNDSGDEVAIGQLKDIGNRDIRRVVDRYNDEIKRGLVITSSSWKQIVNTLNKDVSNKLLESFGRKAKTTLAMCRIIFSKN